MWRVLGRRIMNFRLDLATQQGLGHCELCSETFSQQTENHDGWEDRCMDDGWMGGW